MSHLTYKLRSVRLWRTSLQRMRAPKNQVKSTIRGTSKIIAIQGGIDLIFFWEWSFLLINLYQIKLWNRYHFHHSISPLKYRKVWSIIVGKVMIAKILLPMNRIAHSESVMEAQISSKNMLRLFRMSYRKEQMKGTEFCSQLENSKSPKANTLQNSNQIDTSMQCSIWFHSYQFKHRQLWLLPTQKM